MNPFLTLKETKIWVGRITSCGIVSPTYFEYFLDLIAQGSGRFTSLIVLTLNLFTDDSGACILWQRSQVYRLSTPILL